MIAEIAVSASTNRSYEMNACLPLDSRFAPKAKSLGIEIGDLPSLATPAAFFALEPVSDRELARQYRNSGADGTTNVQHDAWRDSGSSDGGDHEDLAPGLDTKKNENFTDLRGAKIQSPPNGALLRSDEDSILKDGALENVVDTAIKEVSSFYWADVVAQPQTVHSSLCVGICAGAGS